MSTWVVNWPKSCSEAILREGNPGREVGGDEWGIIFGV